MCWQAHRGYPFCSRQSEADDPGPTDDNPALLYGQKHVLSTWKQPEIKKKNLGKKRIFSRQHTIRGIVNSRFCTCRISGTTKAMTFKLCSIKDYHTTTPQKKFHGSSPFRSPVIKLDTLQKNTKITEKWGDPPARPPARDVFCHVIIAAPGQDTEFHASLSERFYGGGCNRIV